MDIAVAGGTGAVGRLAVAQLASRGHAVRVLSRRPPPVPAPGTTHHAVDLATGDGLAAALDGAEVVVDAANGAPGANARSVLVEGSRRLLDAEAAAGVRHHVCVSIVGIERVPMAYYRVKVEQEGVVERGPVPWSIVRATQFHTLLDMLFSSTARFGVLPAARVPVQPVDPAEVAGLLAGIAEGEPRRSRVEMAGPEVLSLADAAQAWRRIRRRRAVPVPVPVPGRLGRALRSGALTKPDADHRGTRTFGDWLRS